ncbi:hypothetical protein HC928_00870 [bacterium]|nr:hypothetical protein [bacterium]
MSNNQDRIEELRTQGAFTFTSATFAGRYTARPNRNNEDAFLVIPPNAEGTDAWLVALFDGMSSGGAGASAADAARTAIEKSWSSANRRNDPIGTIYTLMDRAQQAVLTALNGATGGTTCLIAIIHGDLLTFGHVGDNQLWHNDKLITVDQTPLYRTQLGQALQNKAKQLEERGQALSDDDYYHYGVLENQLTRYLGHPHMGEHPAKDWVEIGQIKFQQGDHLFICTDGVLKAVNVSSLGFQSDNVKTKWKETAGKIGHYREEGDADDATFFLLGVTGKPASAPLAGAIQSYRQINFPESGEDGAVAPRRMPASVTVPQTVAEDGSHPEGLGKPSTPLASDMLPRDTEDVGVVPQDVGVVPQMVALWEQFVGSVTGFVAQLQSSQPETNEPAEKSSASIVPWIGVSGLVGALLLVVVLGSTFASWLNTPQPGPTAASAVPATTGTFPSPPTEVVSATTAPVTPSPPAIATAPSDESGLSILPPVPAEAPLYKPFTRPQPNKYDSPEAFLMEVFGSQANYEGYGEATRVNCGGAQENAWRCLSPTVDLPNLLPPEPWVAFTALLTDTGTISTSTVVAVEDTQYLLQFPESGNRPELSKGATVAIIGVLKPVEGRSSDGNGTWENVESSEEGIFVDVYFIGVLENGEVSKWQRPIQGNPDIFTRPVWLYTTQDALRWLQPLMVNSDGVDGVEARHYLLDGRWRDAGQNGLWNIDVRAVYTFREGEDQYRCARDISSERKSNACSP